MVAHYFQSKKHAFLHVSFWILMFLSVLGTGYSFFEAFNWQWDCEPKGTIPVTTLFSCNVVNWNTDLNYLGAAGALGIFAVALSIVERDRGGKFACWLSGLGLSITLITVPSWYLLVAPSAVDTSLRYYLLTSTGQPIFTHIEFLFSSLDPFPLFVLSQLAIFGGFAFGESVRQLLNNKPKRDKRKNEKGISIRNWSE